jgi:hypothetical protein
MKMTAKKRTARKAKETDNRAFKLVHIDKGNFETPRLAKRGKFGKAKPKYKDHR